VTRKDIPGKDDSPPISSMFMLSLHVFDQPPDSSGAKPVVNVKVRCTLFHSIPRLMWQVDNVWGHVPGSQQLQPEHLQACEAVCSCQVCQRVSHALVLNDGWTLNTGTINRPASANRRKGAVYNERTSMPNERLNVPCYARAQSRFCCLDSHTPPPEIWPVRVAAYCCAADKDEDAHQQCSIVEGRSRSRWLPSEGGLGRAPTVPLSRAPQVTRIWTLKCQLPADI
jgi:hypothetical protein